MPFHVNTCQQTGCVGLRRKAWAAGAERRARNTPVCLHPGPQPFSPTRPRGQAVGKGPPAQQQAEVLSGKQGPSPAEKPLQRRREACHHRRRGFQSLGPGVLPSVLLRSGAQCGEGRGWESRGSTGSGIPVSFPTSPPSQRPQPPRDSRKGRDGERAESGQRGERGPCSPGQMWVPGSSARLHPIPASPHRLARPFPKYLLAVHLGKLHLLSTSPEVLTRSVKGPNEGHREISPHRCGLMAKLCLGAGSAAER